MWESATGAPIAARIAIVGDFLPAGSIAVPNPGDWGAAARGLTSYFEGVDLTIANLECPLDTETLPARALCGLGQIVSSPSAALDYLEEIRARVVGTSNNHAYDWLFEPQRGPLTILPRAPRPDASPPR